MNHASLPKISRIAGLWPWHLCIMRILEIVKRVLVCIWGWYFLATHTHVLCMGSGSATGFFPALSAFFGFANNFVYISVVILNSSLRYQIFEFDINIQMLVWIIGSTYMIQKRRNFEAKVTCQPSILSLLHEIHNGVGVTQTSPCLTYSLLLTCYC